jgi:hypothetical protein
MGWSAPSAGGRSGARPASAPVAATRRSPAGTGVQRSGSVAAPPTATAAAAARSGGGRTPRFQDEDEMRQGRGGGEDRKRHPHRPERPSGEEGRRPDHERRLHRVGQRVQEACVERPEIAEGIVGERRPGATVRRSARDSRLMRRTQPPVRRPRRPQARRPRRPARAARAPPARAAPGPTGRAARVPRRAPGPRR